MSKEKIILSGASKVKGLGFLAKIRFGFFFFVFLIIFMKSLIPLATEGDIQPFIQEVGGRIVHAVQNLNTESLKIITNGFILDTSQGFWSGIWDMIVVYAILWFALYTIYIWIKVIAWLVEKSPFGDSSRFFANYSIAVLIFFTLQLIFLMTTGLSVGESSKLIFESFRNFFKALPIIFFPIGELAEKVSPGKDGLNDLNNLTEIVNNTISKNISLS